MNSVFTCIYFQDIRKFFGPSASTKPANKPPKVLADNKKNITKTEEAKKDTGKNSKGKKSDTSQKNKSKKPSTPSKKLTLDKNVQNEENDSIVVEDFSDEEVIKSSIDSKRNGVKSKSEEGKDKEESESSKPKRDKSSSAQKDAKSKKGSEKRTANDSEEVIEIDSVPSSGSSSTKSLKDTDKPKAKKSLSKSDSSVGSDQKKKLDKKESIPLRTSPRKQNSSTEEKKESRKRNLVSL